MLQRAHQNSTRTSQQITWLRSDGVPQPLVGCTLTGVLDDGMGVTRPITGDLTIVADGVFIWHYSAADVAVAGTFWVQFEVNKDGERDRSFRTTWTVEPIL